MARLAALLLVVGLTAACSGSGAPVATEAPPQGDPKPALRDGAPAVPAAEPTASAVPPMAGIDDGTGEARGPAGGAARVSFGRAPAVPTGPLAPGLERAVDRIFTTGLHEGVRLRTIRTLGGSQDPRVAWLISDLLRFVQVGELAAALLASFEELTGAELEPDQRAPGRSWQAVTDHLIAWDIPAPPGYAHYKENLYTLIEPGWRPFFEDPDAEIDWRLISWGGVQIDDRALGDPEGCPRGCIPALDDPGVTAAIDGDWYPDDELVFGVVVGAEARAYPKNIMEVHELVNDTLGGRRIAVPYCTLCGSAQAYFTDAAGEADLVLRTSGLLSRSNKVMYDLDTRSVFNTFTGQALSGPLQDAGVQLQPITVVTSTWGDWRAAHPGTTIVARDGGIGREYPADPLQGRDDGGPIFPIGDVDQRLPVQESVVGVMAPDGTPLAFPAAAARDALRAGGVIELAGVRLLPDGGGLRAETLAGDPVTSHQAFWFAWSQFHPDTAVWTPLGR